MSTELITRDIACPINSLDAYVFQVNRIPMLSAEEELHYATQYFHHEDLAAAKKLILSHLRFVVKIARSYQGYGLAMGDLIQEGNIGLMKAVKRFDPTIGVRLVSFAVHWIKSEIHEFVIRNWRIVKIATTKAQRKCFFNLRKMKQRLGWFNQQEVDQVAEDLGVSAADVLAMEARLNSMDMAFDAPVNESDENNYSPSHFLEADNADPANLVADVEFSSDQSTRLHEAMMQLDERDQSILQARWLTDEKKTLQELALEFGVSAERIRQLEKNALAKLKKIIQ